MVILQKSQSVGLGIITVVCLHFIYGMVTSEDMLLTFPQTVCSLQLYLLGECLTKTCGQLDQLVGALVSIAGG